MRTFLSNQSIVLLLAVVLLSIQNLNAQVKKTLSSCRGDQVTLTATGGTLYSWSDGSIGDKLTVTVGNTTTYTVTVATPNVSTNLVVNGDFTSTVKNFDTDYGYYDGSGTLYDGDYWIGPNAHDVHSDFVGLDHTVGDGNAPNNFLVINGQPGSRPWAQTITVVPGTTYAFSCWISTVSNVAPSYIGFSINSTAIGSVFPGPATYGSWQQFYTLWTAPAGITSAKIEITDMSGMLSNGIYLPVTNDDFGIDDISFSTISTSTIEYTVSPRNCGLDTLHVTACYYTNIDLMATDNATSYLWDDGTTTQKRTIKATGPSSYTVTVTKAAVSSTTTYLVSTQICNTATTKVIKDCESSTITLSAEGGSSYLWSNKSTKSSLSILNKSYNRFKDTVVITQPENLLGNSDFKNWPKEVDYPYTPSWSKLPVGNISTVYDANDAKTGLVGSGRPSSSAYNYFLMVRNSLSASSGQIFRRVVADNISPNTTYDFNFWYAVFQGQASFHVLINGVQIGQKNDLSKPVNTWVPFAYQWNSGTATSAVIEFVNDNTTIDSYYGFDDITLVARPRSIIFDLQPITCGPIPVDTIKVDACSGEATVLQSQTLGFYKWDDASTQKSRTITASTATNYQVTVTGDLIKNGDFSLGNTLFTSELKNTNWSGMDSAVYTIISNAATLGYVGGDHTTGSGIAPDNFMMVTDFFTKLQAFWQQSVNVISGTDYTFSFWVKTFNSNPDTYAISPGTASIAVLINGASVGSTFFIPSSNPGWTQCVVRWNSGTASVAKFELLCEKKNVVKTNTYNGATFGVDDIVLSTATNEKIEVFAVKPHVCWIDSLEVTACNNSTVDLMAVDNATAYLWEDGTTTQKRTINVTGPGNYFVTVTKGGIDLPTKYIVSTQTCNMATTKVIKDCNTTTLTLSPEGGSSFLWDDGSTKSTLSVSNAAPKTYTVTVTQAENMLANSEMLMPVVPADYPVSGLASSGAILLLDNANWVPGLIGTHRGAVLYDRFLMVRNSLTPSNGQVFRRVVADKISQNTTYDFNCWYAVFQGQASFHILVNGVQIGKKNDLSKPLNAWFPFTYQWNSGTATSAVIEFVNDNTTVDSYFGIDGVTLVARPRTVTFDLQPIVCGVVAVDTIKVDACSGQSVVLESSITGTYKWDDASTLKSRTITASTATNYQVAVTGELVKNGDFSQGNVSFTTDYSNGTWTSMDSSAYQIVANASAFGFTGGDHTTGSGSAPDNFMIVYDFESLTQTFWKQSVNVISSTDYTFSFWVKTFNGYHNSLSISPGTAQVAVRINGVNVGSMFYIPTSNPGWTQCVVRWNSGLSSSATFELLSASCDVISDDYLGAMFGVDDIALSTSVNEKIEVFAVTPVSCTVTLSACENETLTLRRNDGVAYKWSDNSTKDSLQLNAGTTAQQVKVTVTAIPDNLVVNGNFNNPTASVGANPSYYSLCSPGVCSDFGFIGAGKYWVGDDGTTAHSGFAGKGHGGSGNFMIINGSSTVDVAIWSQTIAVKPGTTYAFSAWLSNMNSSSPAKLQFRINGVLLKTPFTSASGVGVWEQFYATWNSQTATTAFIEITNQNNSSGGNDFGLDDISLSTIRDMEYTYNINPIPCDINIVNNDTAICRGDSVELHVRTGGQLVGWSPDSVINRPSLADSWAKPLTTNTYTATAKFLKTNLITNGDFEAGNTGFVTDYTLIPSTTVLGNGKYFISTSTHYGSTTWPRLFDDHTSGSGNMMVFDGDAVGNKRAYSTTVSVVAGTKYLFSTWIKNVHKQLGVNPPLLQFNVDGVDLGQIKFPLNEPDWISFSTPYTATTTGTITIAIRNKNTNSAQNDFALDDIFFGEYVDKTDKVTVTVKPLPKVTLRKDTTIFAGTPLTIDAGAGATNYNWSTTAATQTISVTNAGTYIVTATINGCKATDTVEVKEKFGELAYYRFCGCSMKDYTGNGYDATLFGPPNPTCVNSIYDQGYHFAGDMAEYIQPKILPELTQSLSVMAWIKPEAFMNTNGLTPIFTQGTSNDFFTLWVTPSSVQLLLNWGTPIESTISAPATLVANQYYHVAATYDYQNHTVSLFLNGALIGTGTYNYPIQSANEGFYIGSSFPGDPEFFTGVIDEVRLFNKPLSATQIDSIYKINNKTKIDLGVDVQLTEPATAQLNAPAGFAKYLWSDASTAKSLTVNKEGNYWAYVTDADGCSYIDTVRVKYKYIDTLNYTLCENSNYTLRTHGGDVYTWENGTSLDNLPITATANSQTWVDVHTDSTDVRYLYIITTKQCIMQAIADTTICAGDSARVAAQTNGSFMGWSPNTNLKDTMQLTSQWLKPAASISYIAKAQFPQNNLLMNGNFEEGKTGFKSDYDYTTSITPGEYFVGNTPYNSFTSSWARDFGDHTTGTGKMFIADGDDVSGSRVYYANLFVTAGLKYTFSVWVKGVHIDANLNPAKLRFFVDGKPLGAIDYPKNVSKWIQFSTVWTATTTGTVEIGIRNQNTNGSGNDFALDDISFGEFTTITDTVKITVNTLPTVTATVNPATICVGKQTKLEASGAVNYVWSPTFTPVADSISPATTATYNVTGTDANGCKDTSKVTVTVNPLPTPSITSDDTDNKICFGGTVKLDAGSFTAYKWSTNETTQTIDIKSVGTHAIVLTVTDANNCKNTATKTVEVDTLPTVTATANPATICVGKQTKLAVTGADTYVWTPSVTITDSISPATTETYNVEGTDVNGCKDTSKVTVTVNPLPTPSITSDDTDNKICFGGTVKLDAGSFTAYKWSTNESTQTIDIKSVGTHAIVVTVTDANNCKNTATKQVEVDTLPTVTATANPAAICVGKQTKLAVTGADTYVWTPAVVTTDSISPATTATYNVEGTDVNGCKDTSKVTVTVNPLPTPNIMVDDIDNKICFGGTIKLDAGTFTAYKWSTNETTQTIDIKSVGTHAITVTVTDANNCKNTAINSVVVDTLPTVVASAVPAVICIGNQTMVSAMGALTYAWNPAISGTTLLSPSTTTTYNVTGTDGNGCKDTSTVTVTVNPLPTPVIKSNDDNNEICDGETIKLSTATAYKSYQWSSNETTATIDLTAVGTYNITVTVTDNNDCQNTAITSATVHPLPVVGASAQPDFVCKGKQTKLIGSGTGIVTFKWSDGEEDNQLFTLAETKTYTVTGTDGNKCSNTAKVLVTLGELPDIAGDKQTVCEGTPYTFTAPLGMKSYKWSDGSTNSSLTVTQQNWYYVTVVGQNGCENSTQFRLETNPLPDLNIKKNPNSCDSTRLEADVSNVVISKYSWNSGKDSAIIMATKTGIYKVTVTSSLGCSATDQVSVTIYKTPHPITLQQDFICKEQTAHFSDLSDLPNSQVYAWYHNYKLMPNETTKTISNLTEKGRYTVVAQNNGCVDSSVSVLYVDVLPEVQTFGKQRYCFDKKPDTLTIPGAIVRWFVDADTIQFLQAGNKYVPVLPKGQDSITVYATVTNYNNCVSHPKAVTVWKIPEYTGLKIQGPERRCADKLTGEIFQIEGLKGNITWRATHPFVHRKADSSSILISGLVAGVDTIYASTTDTNNCIYTTHKEVYTAPLPRADFEWDVYTGPMKITYTNTSDSATVPVIKQKLGNTYYWTFWKTDEVWKHSRAIDSSLHYPYGYHDVSLMAINEYGCKDSIRKTVFMDVKDNLYVPTVFAPGKVSEEVGECRPKGINMVFYEISIYDQWGNLLWFSDKLIGGQPLEGWDGTYKGNTMKSDVYIWKIRAKFSSGAWWGGKNEDDYVFGNVFLLR